MRVIFISGLLCTNQVWGQLNNIRNQYECKDADVVSFDTVEKMSAAVIESLLSQEAIIIGISMGGYVAIDIALKSGINLKKLILINTTSNSVNPATIKEREKAIQLAEEGKMKDILENSKGICYFHPKDEWLLLEEKMAYSVGTEAYIRQQRAIINRRNYSGIIQNITADTLIISGLNDKVIPHEDSIFMKNKIKNANLVTLNECGHLATLEKSNIVMDCVQKFLADHR